jgi:periplasmic divalent cation tolerance protein
VSLHLAACVNIADVKSIFEWKGKQENQSEKLLVIKTLKSRFTKIEELVKATHSYDCPEIIAFEISDASEDYTEWVKKMCETGSE